MKKKIALFLSVLSVVIMLAACGTDPTKVDYNGKTYGELQETVMESATKYATYSAEELQEELSALKEAEGEEALSVQIVEKWLAAMEISGSYVGVKEDSFKIEKSGKTLTTDVTLQFEKRLVTFQLVYNYHNMKVTGVTIDPVYSMGEKISNAALNTVICMSIVFIILGFISILISSFKIFPYLEKKKKEKAAKKATQNVIETVKPQEVQSVSAEDDTELVAVIAAAIAAYEGTSTGDFVVRSIRRR